MLGISFVIVSSVPARELESALESSADAEVRGRVSRLEDLPRVVAEERPDALLVSLDGDPEAVFKALDPLADPRPLLFFHGPDDSRLILQAMRSGGYEYIAPTADEVGQLLSALRRAAQERGGASSPPASSLIAMIGAKGGVGTSFAACQLGAALARLGGSTALVDGHQRHGDLALYMDLAPRYDFASLAAGDGPIDTTYLHSTLAPHASGVSVLAAPKDPEEAEQIDAGCVVEVVDLLLEEFAWVIWDTPQDFDERNLRIFDQASPIVLVTTPDVPSLSHARMQLDLLARLGHREEAVRLVLNRSEKRAAVSTREASEFLGRPIDAAIPNDYASAAACVNEGRTLSDVAPNSAIDRAFSELGTSLHGWCDRPLASAPKKKLFERFRKKR